MTNEDYKPRFSFEISDDQRIRANKLIAQYGLRKSIFGKLLDDVLDLIEDHGNMGVGALMSDDTPALEFLVSRRVAKGK